VGHLSGSGRGGGDGGGKSNGIKKKRDKSFSIHSVGCSNS
jgi:hypothetical protein